MEFKELKNKSVKELHKLLAENREKLRDMRFSVSAKQLKNIREIREVKKLIARILTVLKMDTSQDQDLENNQVKE
ncbi:MAG: 50S ribosomal protein L29 [Candidatus Komeilibacteria bacterium CG10_big_fil_rev_8_21_14_0_10_41_13]|uniref:Large ribosomal subunit protein uL29 n=1 Tax=Candidatus Komeilibacteria bacterium CG10_big_fil_rev_8_21_14_0_10_41_13 TaxID=1974476 RepID=A0A2M6WDG1_9BACT|nr:MAG: 50S ribosomal protein L29 [Candidatus Komeilibacteria bacterium CG10_big_fil_rev_8_21_14_0_10_41_13]